jgi:hypothetical protein
MKLFILRPVDDLPIDDNPWEPWFDKNFGFVIRSASEEAARQIADANAQNENSATFMGRPLSQCLRPWLDPRYSTCSELTTDGDVGVVIFDLRST